MNKKHTLKKTAALLLSLGLTVGATGCNFLVTDSVADLKQIVATVDITKNLGKSTDYASVKAGVEELIENKGLSTDIPKRDLVAYFLNVGMTYVNSYGYSYADTFNLLMDGLVNNKIMAQFAVAYYLKNGFSDNVSATADDCLAYVESAQNAASGVEKSLLKAHPEVLTMQYFLTENGTDDKAYNEAVYSLKKSLNDSLDSAEKNYIKAEDHEHAHEESRTTPTNVNTETEEYIPSDYDIYTGRNALDKCGEYEKVDGSTATTRKKAYNTFLSNLQGYGLITENEDTAVITELNYYYIELSSSLSRALVDKYLDSLNEEAIEALEADNYEYVKGKYDEIKSAQEYSYKKDLSAFETALDGVSDNSFVLYGKEGFGFIYNILLPFSASQEQQYAAAKNKGLTQDEIFNARKSILANVQAKDLRTGWFGEDEHTNYSYAASENYFDNGKAKGEDTYLFFENNMTKTDKYETLGQYFGKYPYNGTATQNADGEWEFKPNKLDINSFISEMENYIDYAVGKDVTISGAYSTKYNAKEYTDKDGVVDYSKFIYYTGKVELTNTNAKDYFYKGSVENEDVNDSYAALSAVNELMFAYSTDPGCLNSYMGYAVSPYKTDFVPEFEYAAQAAIQGADLDGDGSKDFEGGVGTYVVAPSDYGWHIIYVTFVYGADGYVYGEEFNVDDVEKEGTFSNLFYESLKSTSATNYTKDAQNAVLNDYKTSGTRFVSRYQDLLDLDK